VRLACGSSPAARRPRSARCALGGTQGWQSHGHTLAPCVCVCVHVCVCVCQHSTAQHSTAQHSHSSTRTGHCAPLPRLKRAHACPSASCASLFAGAVPDV
jgi:hypothetical protein